MQKIERFDQAKRALEQTHWRQRQTEQLNRSSHEMIERSRALIEAVRSHHTSYQSEMS